MRQSKTFSRDDDQWHSLLYALAHQVLPEMILFENEYDLTEKQIFSEVDPRQVNNKDLENFYAENLEEDLKEIDELLRQGQLQENLLGTIEDALWAEMEAELNLILTNGTSDIFNDSSLLQKAWHKAWLQFNLVEVPPIQEFYSEHRVTDNLNILLFSFPPPLKMPGTWMTAAIKNISGLYRYFTLEKTTNRNDTKEEKAILGEWTLHQHHNYGLFNYPVEDKEAFIQACVQKYRADLL